MVLKPFERSDRLHAALSYLVPIMFTKLKSLLESNQLYTFNHEELRDFTDVAKCQSERGRIPVLF